MSCWNALPFVEVPEECFHNTAPVCRWDDEGLESFVKNIQVMLERAVGSGGWQPLL